LAKQIVSFLRDTDAHPNLQSITLFGDALIVPTSYYFNINHYDPFSNWIPSDFFYASPDYDMIPNFQVGRLPASDATEADWIVQKYENWKTNLDESWFNNVRLFAGSPYEEKFLQAELATIETINNHYLSGLNIEKNFHSNGLETPQKLLSHFSDDNTGVLFCSGHGSGYGFALTNGQITYNDIVNMAPSTNYPVLIMSSCLNGAFDFEYMNYGATESFAEGVLFAEAGSIVYFGATRVAHGRNYHFFNPNGELIISQAVHIQRMLYNNISKAWSEGNLQFGEIYQEALNEYMLYFNSQDILDYVTMYEFILLGDPVFSILSQNPGVQYDNITFEVEPEPYVPGFSLDEPVYYFTDSYQPEISITGITNSPTVNVRIYTIVENNNMTVTELLNTTINSSPFTIEFIPQIENIFTVCFENEDLGESRLFFRTEWVENIPPETCWMYEIDYQGTGGSYNLSWTPSIDVDDGLDSYTLCEMKNPIAFHDSCENIDKWMNNGFSVSDLGYNNTHSLHSGTGNNLSNTITSIAPVLIG
ncbi:MAG: hypothetical protein K8R58_06580, partial [Bacteroidales bacterium]|nr:hypothetical protein [Bacteroidales bacterium]